MKDLSIVIPCKNEDPAFLSKTYTELTAQGAEVIIVDDGATMTFTDNTPTVWYIPSQGYGYAIKQGIKQATRPFICTADGDGQHTVSEIQKLYTVFKTDPDLKLLIGTRWNIKENSIRRFGRKALNFLASLISGHYQIDLNSGLRIFTRKEALAYSPILCDTFSFTTSLTMSYLTDQHKSAWFPVNVLPRANGKSHVKVFKDGWITLYYIVWVGLALRTRRIRACLSGRSM